MKKFLISKLTLLILTIQGCSKYSEGVDFALEQAGENKTELIKVLDKYNKHPKDSLKLRAAQTLIANIPF